NIEDQQRIRVAKGSGEVRKQIARARIPMRLKSDMHLAKPALPRRSQRSFDLRRMVPIVVNHAHPASPPPHLKAAVHSAELIKPGADGYNVNIQTHAHCN